MGKFCLSCGKEEIFVKKAGLCNKCYRKEHDCWEPEYISSGGTMAALSILSNAFDATLGEILRYILWLQQQQKKKPKEELMREAEANWACRMVAAEKKKRRNRQQGKGE